MNEYSLFKPITLTFFNMLNVFYVNIRIVHAIWHILGSIFTEKCVWNRKKINKIGL